MNAHKLTSKKGCTLLKVAIILFLFLITANGNECFQRVYHRISMIAYRTTTQTEAFKCGLFSWGRCRRTIYIRTSILQYMSTSQPVCCEGYILNTDKNGCLPICQDQCIHPMVCVAPNTCECPGGYRGTDCSIPICEDCSHHGQQCVAPNQCECRSGFNGTGCTSDIDECQINNGGCEQFCNNINGSYLCSCQQQFMLSDDQMSCIGTLNTMWNILSNGTLSLRWERPTWDERNIIRQVKINCSVSDNVILEDRSISDDNMIILDLDGLNLNAIIICCHTIITLMNETGPQKCEALEYHQRSTIGEHSQSVTTGGYHTSPHAITPASSVNTEAVIAGTSVAVLLLLLLVSVIVVVLSMLKRKTFANDVSASVSDHYSMQNEEVYNVTYHRGVDRPCQGGVEKQTFSMVA